MKLSSKVNSAKYLDKIKEWITFALNKYSKQPQHTGTATDTPTITALQSEAYYLALQIEQIQGHSQTEQVIHQTDICEVKKVASHGGP
jgi:hypothetical protein